MLYITPSGSKIHFSAVKNGHAAAGLLLNPLLTEEFARKESMVVPAQDEYEEARRLCMYEGKEARVRGAPPQRRQALRQLALAKGNAPSSVVCAREGLDMAIQQEVEAIDGDALTAEAGDDVPLFALGMLTGSLNTKLVVKLLGARAETTTQLGGRTVISHAKFGSMTGVRPSTSGGVEGAAGTHTHRTRPPTPRHAPRVACEWGGGPSQRNHPPRNVRPFEFARGRGGGQHGTRSDASEARGVRGETKRSALVRSQCSCE